MSNRISFIEQKSDVISDDQSESVFTSEINNIGKIVDDLRNSLIESSSSSGNDASGCPNHLEKYEFYCCTCDCCICNSCIVRTGKHCGHVIDRFTEVYSENMGEIIRLVEKSHLKLQEIQEILPKEIDKQVENVKKVKEKMQKRNNLMNEFAVKNLEVESGLKVENLEGQKNNFKLEMANVKNKIIDIENLLLITSKANVIMKSPEIISTCQELNTLDASEFIHPEKYTDILTNSMIPEYYHKMFFVSNFTELRDNGKTVYSEYLIDDLQNVWRLQLDPHGNTNNPNYLSAYVELVDGIYDRYEFCIELINKLPSKNIRIEGEMDFKQRKSWGKTRFIHIEKLMLEQFLALNDTLTFRFAIRPPSILQKMAYQRKLIQTLQKQLTNIRR